jgi:hypothetical protein
MPLLYALLALILTVIAAWVVNTRIPADGTVKAIVNVAIALVAVGSALWLINTYVPMAGSIKAILNIVVVVATCVRVLQTFHLWSGVVRLWRNLIGSRISHS